METIYKSETRFIESYDWIGSVFIYKDKIYRLIRPECTEYVKELLQSEMFQELVRMKYFPETVIADVYLEMDVFPESSQLIIEHKKLIVSYASQWTFSMMKDACIFLLKFRNFLKRYGYDLHDGQWGNVFFEKNKPIFIDLGSIIPITRPSYFAEEFIDTCVYPVILGRRGEKTLAEAIIAHPPNKVIPRSPLAKSRVISKEVKSFFDSVIPLSYFDKLRSLHPYCSTSDFLERKLRDLRPHLLNIDFLDKNLNVALNESEWGDYGDDYINASELQVNERFSKIIQYIEKICDKDVHSIIDLAGNSAGLSYAIEKNCATKFNERVNIDYDEVAIEKSRVFLQTNNSSVQTLLMNLCAKPPVDWLFDVVLAMAITHHLFLTQGMPINTVFQEICAYMKRFILVEFMPLGLWGGDGAEHPPIPDWYTDEWFSENFQRHFRLLYKEQIDENRILYVGELKK